MPAMAFLGAFKLRDEINFLVLILYGSVEIPPYPKIDKIIMLHTDVNVDKKFQPSIFYRNRENHVSSKTFQTDRQTDISNYRVALPLSIPTNFKEASL